MGKLCTRGVGLAATSLWRNIDAGMANARRGNKAAAWQCARTILLIHHEATLPSLRAKARDGYVRISQALGWPKTASDLTEDTRHA